MGRMCGGLCECNIGSGRIWIMGSIWAGKTTLMRTLCGVLKLSYRYIFLSGRANKELGGVIIIQSCDICRRLFAEMAIPYPLTLWQVVLISLEITYLILLAMLI